MKEQDLIEEIVGNMEKVIFGKTAEIYDILKGIFAGGHILIEDVPGVGKTTIIKTLAKILDLSYSRIQFTPDLLPSDITGISIYNQKLGDFQFRKGPIFANIILADEINRTSPKTQSALLEVMEENQVSEGINTYKLEEPFIVLATQNPIEYEGTFILPEAQLDRFMMKVRIGYADKENESKILQIYGNEEPIKKLKIIGQKEEIVRIQEKVRQVFAAKEVSDYIVSIVNATRENKYIALGASTRAALALLKVAKANAFIDYRDYVIPQDVKNNAKAVLCHRITLSSMARAKGLSVDEIIEEILDKIPLPKVR
ncbi:MoxR family ATPase [Clostridium sp. YIM B02515]|uniref:MoxR family ATPase n=1 Tax=Clostridium rhizosphaerae TaxID=2803861 RepID=A0ABS1TBN7_9CLOT|nr:MoxR family ATPase [Clostridium rhizosphaerae]MBL4936686.1 MoxR family ATPase [Clostridium rhizosphaerae]